MVDQGSQNDVKYGMNIVHGYKGTDNPFPIDQK